MTVQEINRSIIAGGFTNDELISIGDAIKFARSQMVRANTGKMVIGTAVKFRNPKTGVVYIGKVNKVKQKYVLVDTNVGVRYNVPANLLELA